MLTHVTQLIKITKEIDKNKWDAIIKNEKLQMAKNEMEHIIRKF